MEVLRERLLTINPEAEIQSVYENMVLGKVSEDLCIGLLDKYRAEKNELETEFDEIQNRLDAFSQDEHDVDEEVIAMLA